MAYDAAGQLLSRKHSDGNTSAYTYDDDSRTATTAGQQDHHVRMGPSGPPHGRHLRRGGHDGHQDGARPSSAGLPNRVDTPPARGPVLVAGTWAMTRPDASLPAASPSAGPPAAPPTAPRPIPTTRPTSSPPPPPAPRPLPTPTTRSASSATAPASPISPAARTSSGNPPAGCP
ncbi:RHS repeat domain-containing protein [Streptomyces sp. NPDC017988]|uniref:RHS repeat domain-containing protein n=1 Tax=Streptomyces sp. NPDC017988 TaxID=3365025 RepID=UPI0037B9B86E